jgi:hypothetical protein
MSQPFTIQVSDRVIHQAKRAAANSQRPIEEVLAAWLEQATFQSPVELLADEDVLALTKLSLTDEQQGILSHLLEKNQENALSVGERRQLDEMMRFYEQGLLRKAQALRVAVERGLIAPLKS